MVLRRTTSYSCDIIVVYVVIATKKMSIITQWHHLPDTKNIKSGKYLGINYKRAHLKLYYEPLFTKRKGNYFDQRLVPNFTPRTVGTIDLHQQWCTVTEKGGKIMYHLQDHKKVFDYV